MIEDKEKRYNSDEKWKMDQIVQWMIRNDCVETHVMIGKKQVCFKRDNKDTYNISIHEMNNTLDNNEKNVTAFNKRPK